MASEADPGPQLKKVMDFRKQLEDTRQVLYHYFEDGKSFSDEVDKHLRAYAKDELPKPDRARDMVVLPVELRNEVEKAKAAAAEEVRKAQDEAEKARLQLEEMQLQTAEDAAQLSMEGKIKFARQKFADIVTKTANLQILFLAFEFYHRTGDLDSALDVLHKWLNISGPEKETSDTANAYGNLGNVYKTRGKLERAEEMYHKALRINESLSSKEGMARDYGNLGNVYQMRGELERAEEMHLKALEIDESLWPESGYPGWMIRILPQCYSFFILHIL